MPNSNFKGWNTKEHLDHFDFWNRMTKGEFLFKYGSFQEQRFLKSYLGSHPASSILDVGCATGTGYRYLTAIGFADRATYTGVDISGSAIGRAQALYPSASFNHVPLDQMEQYLAKMHDVVISRDTIMHQEKPYEFLDRLLGAARNALIIRLRTRDNGDTVEDPKLSCQAHYNEFWMPYIVLNTGEFIDRLRGHDRVKTITICKSHQVLGGKFNRYLPKELYFNSAGGAETSVVIEMQDGAVRQQEPEIVEIRSLEGHDHIRSKLGLRLYYKVLNALRGHSL